MDISDVLIKNNLVLDNNINSLIGNTNKIIIEYTDQQKIYKIAFSNILLNKIKDIFPIINSQQIIQFPLLSVFLEIDNKKVDITEIIRQYSGINGDFYKNYNNIVLTPEVIIYNNSCGNKVVK